MHTTTWADVERFYDGLDNNEAGRSGPLRELVRFIASSPYASGLYPAASHDALSIGRHANFASGHGEIQVRWDGVDQTFLFTYRQRPDEAEPWSRSCDAAGGRATFERLLHKRLRWFHEG